MKRAIEMALPSLLLIVLVLAAKADLLAAPGEVVITHASMSTSAIPLWVAQRQNFFGKYGVKSKVVWVRQPGPDRLWRSDDGTRREYTRRRADVMGVVSCSAPKQFYSERIGRQPAFRETIEKAEAMVAEGRGEELLSIAVGATPGIFSARTHLNKYGKDDRNDCRPYAKRIGCPLLAIVGGAEPKFFHEYAQELVAAAGADSTYKLVDGGNHFYNRHTAEIVEIIAGWLEQFAD